MSEICNENGVAIQAVIQNLKDAGCDDILIQQFLRLRANGCFDENLRFLSIHRKHLLDALHYDQKRIDSLDYLIYTIKKEKERGL